MKRVFRLTAAGALTCGLVLAGTAANAADTGWLPNNVCYAGYPVGNAKFSSLPTADAKKVTVWETKKVSGDIGVKIHYGGLLSSVLWAGTEATWTAPYAISEIRVYH